MLKGWKVEESASVNRGVGPSPSDRTASAVGTGIITSGGKSVIAGDVRRIIVRRKSVLRFVYGSSEIKF